MAYKTKLILFFGSEGCRLLKKLESKVMNIFLAYPGILIGSGGMEKVCASLANALCDRGHDVTVGYCYKGEERPFYSSKKVFHYIVL